eukprot:jgi/Botrbrau1/285/Bobra.0022s0253.1
MQTTYLAVVAFSLLGLSVGIKLPKEPLSNPKSCVRKLSTNRPEAKAVLAVMTAAGPEGAARRNYARKTWFPSTQHEMDRLYMETGVLVRFAVGRSRQGNMLELESEEANYGEFFYLPLKDSAEGETLKLVALWETIAKRVKAKYIIKADDDSYVRMDRLVQAISQWDTMGAGYIGCMQQRNNQLAMTLSPEDPLYDPHHAIYDGDSTYAADTGFLAVEGRVVDGLLQSGLSLRVGGHADTMVGWVMKAFNVSHFDDRRLCYTTSCDSRMVVYHWGRAIKAAMTTEATSDQEESSVCCPTREQCSPQHARMHLLAVRCVEQLHGGDPKCAGPTLGLNNELDLILEVDRHHHMRSDWQWVTSHPVHNSALQTVDSD